MVGPAQQNDFFTRTAHAEYAGKHLLIDIWGATSLDNRAHIEKALTEAVTAAGATLLHIHSHQFTSSGGISGAAILAESHITVHTWPERDFAAFDVFMCGNAQPERVVDIIKAYFTPERVEVNTHHRGYTEL